MKTAAVLLSALWLAACATTPPVLPEGPARLGQTVRVSGPTVRPLKVIEDSRCPANARCVWAGRVVLRAVVSGGSWRRTVDLTLGDRGVPVADGTLRLVSVSPEKMAGAGQGFPPSAYRFGFEFSGGL